MPKIRKKCYICTVAFPYFYDVLREIRTQNGIEAHFGKEIEREFYTQLNYC